MSQMAQQAELLTATPLPPSRGKLGPGRLLRILLSNGQLLAGCLIVLTITAFALAAPWISSFQPQTANPDAVLQAPNGTHYLGTDINGMDVFARLIYAPRVDLSIALLSTGLAILIGTPIGVIAGYYSNIWSEAAMRIADLLQSFPVFVLGMALVVLTGQKIQNLVIAIAIVNAPVYARLVRTQAVYVKQRLFIEAARAAGLPDRKIVFRHLLPNSLGPIFAMSSVTIGTAMLLTAGLSFIGAGVRVPTPEWGSMIAVGTSSLMEGGAWWPSVFPGLVLSLTVLGFGMIGDSLAAVTDPRRRND
ncbi:MAG: ABC transporter permease [Nitrospiraceae bacterium]|nr:ABC transporter permease [Nitrospiraceae bacterium]